MSFILNGTYVTEQLRHGWDRIARTVSAFSIPELSTAAFDHTYSHALYLSIRDPVNKIAPEPHKLTFRVDVESIKIGLLPLMLFSWGQLLHIAQIMKAQDQLEVVGRLHILSEQFYRKAEGKVVDATMHIATNGRAASIISQTQTGETPDVIKQRRFPSEVEVYEKLTGAGGKPEVCSIVRDGLVTFARRIRTHLEIEIAAGRQPSPARNNVAGDAELKSAISDFTHFKHAAPILPMVAHRMPQRAVSYPCVS